LATVKDPHEPATHVTTLHVDVTLPAAAVQVELPDPLYPSSHCRNTLCVVKPVLVPSFWSLCATVRLPQDAATHVIMLHVDVSLPASAAHTDGPDPLYPESHCTNTLCVVKPLRKPAF